MWFRGKPNDQSTPTAPPPIRKLPETNPQIPQLLQADDRGHPFPPRMAPLNHITIGHATADPTHDTRDSFHILDGEYDQPRIFTNHSSTDPQLYAARFRRHEIFHRSPDLFIIIFGLIVHLCLMFVCVMSNAHYPNLLHSLSKEYFIVWKLVLAAAFL